MKPEDYLETILSVYDEYMEKDEFELDPKAFYVKKEPPSPNIYIGCTNSSFTKATKNIVSDTLKIQLSKTTNICSFLRRSPIVAGELIGELRFQSYIDFNILAPNRETIKNLFIKFFDEYFHSKIGIGGEIIRATSNRMINVSGLDSGDIYPANFLEEGTFIDFLINCTKTKNDINEYAIYHYLQKRFYDNKNNMKEYLSDDRLISYFFGDNIIPDPQWLKAYGNVTEEELETLFQEAILRDQETEGEMKIISRPYK